MHADEQLDAVFRREWPAIVGALARRTGDVQLAEDATQDAFAAAAATWPARGVPPNPGGWLALTARRRAIDRLRRRRGELGGEAAERHLAALAGPGDEIRDEIGDDRLRLVLACCHPALALPAQVALTLRLVGGMSTAQIARAFLVEEAAMAQRLVRAKEKIRCAGIPLDLPDADALPDRVAAVRGVLYLIFNEGYLASDGAVLRRGELCDEAIRLARLLHELLPASAETAGLLALMLLLDARGDARLDDAGDAIRLADQDRARWDRTRIAEGTALLRRTLARRRPGPLQLQAATAAVHDEAADARATDWAQIAALYGALAELDPSPVVVLNRAVAVGMADGPRAGLTALAPLLASAALAGYAPLHAAHADLLARLGDDGGAARAWRRAAELSANAAQRRFLLGQARVAAAQ